VKVPGSNGGSDAIRQRWLSLVVGVFLIVALAVGLTACGGGSSSSSGSEEATTSEEAGGGGEEAGGGEEGGGNSELASFEEKLEAAKETEPNHWEGPTDPVTPPKKFKVAGVSCASVLEGCLTPLEGAEDAAKELGWEFEIYDGEGDPTVQAKRIQQAIQKGADAIILAAVEGNSVKSALQEAEQAGIIIISTTNGTAPGEQGYAVDTSPNVTAIGNAVADWMVVDSGGEAVVAPFVDREFQTNLDFSEGIEEELKKCSGCKIESPVDFVATDVGSKLGGNTTAYLQQHPDVGYFYSTYDPAMAEQVAAVQQAGIQVKSCSQLGDAQNLSFIKNEQIQACDGAWDNEYEGYATIDQIIRLANEEPLWESKNVPERYKYGENIPWVLLEKDNLPESEETYRAPFDYISEYQKLWGLK
jgi:ABC-type sugar transport system substrate-binding protein